MPSKPLRRQKLFGDDIKKSFFRYLYFVSINLTSEHTVYQAKQRHGHPVPTEAYDDNSLQI
jgi:hypothetical protein